jgi:hypothetical protein
MYLLAAILVVGGSIAFSEFLKYLEESAFLKYSEKSPDSILYAMFGFMFGYVLLCILLLAVGANRMVFDRANGISTFYTSHLITRGQVFIMRLLLGAMFVVLFYIPLECWFVWRLLQWHAAASEYPPVEKLGGMMFFLLLFLMGCYNLGMKTGLYNKRLTYILGTACLGALFLSFIVLKGFGSEAAVILVILNAAIIYSTWCDYSAVAL